MNGNFIIQDWAGQYPFGETLFETYEDGWDFLSIHFAHLSDKELDDTLGEYNVMPVNERLTKLTYR